MNACVSPGEVGKVKPEIVALPMVSCSKMNLLCGSTSEKINQSPLPVKTTIFVQVQ